MDKVLLEVAGMKMAGLMKIGEVICRYQGRRNERLREETDGSCLCHHGCSSNHSHVVYELCMVISLFEIKPIDFDDSAWTTKAAAMGNHGVYPP